MQNVCPCEMQLIRHRHIKHIKLETLCNQTQRQYGSAKQYIFSSLKKILKNPKGFKYDKV